MKALLALLALALPATAQETVTHTDEIPVTPAPFVLPLTLPRFDPALGILLSVDVRVDGTHDGRLGAENLLVDSSVFVDAERGFELHVIGIPDTFVDGYFAVTAFDLEPFDGVLDFAGSSGSTLSFQGGSGLLSEQYTQPVDLLIFTGPAGDPGQLAVLALASNTCSFSVDPAAPVETLCEAEASMRVEVTYTYALDCNGNGVPDDEDLCDGPVGDPGGGLPCSLDCNANGIPDECEPDCDADGIPDDCDPDSCEPTDLLCEEFDRFADLTPNDTLTVVTSQHNPQQEQGYLWVYAVDAQGRGIGRDALIGQLLVVDGLETLQYAVNAVDYRAAVAPGALTDVDLDGVRDLDGLEYEKTGGQILVPRFLGSDPQRQTRGELILVGLSGGSQFTTTADFLVYNDDEDAFSANYTFYCWDKVSTLEVSNVFSNQWLTDFSGQNPAKGLGNIEYGWFEIDGGVASSTFFSLLDPALYAVYVEKVGDTAAADLPFERCTQSGHLLPRAVSGDNSETNGAPSDEDCAQRHTGRKPASLLLFPEFDNRFGVATAVTVTNTSATLDVRTHWIYVGRYGN